MRDGGECTAGGGRRPFSLLSIDVGKGGGYQLDLDFSVRFARAIVSKLGGTDLIFLGGVGLDLAAGPLRLVVDW